MGEEEKTRSSVGTGYLHLVGRERGGEVVEENGERGEGRGEENVKIVKYTQSFTKVQIKI